MKTKIVQMERGNYRPRGPKYYRVGISVTREEKELMERLSTIRACSVSAIMAEAIKALNEKIEAEGSAE